MLHTVTCVFQQRVAVVHKASLFSVSCCRCVLDHVLMPLDFASTSLLVHSKFVLNPSTPLVQNTHQHTLALVRMQHLPNRFSPTQWPSGIWQCDTALFRCGNATPRVLQPVRSSCLRATLCIQTLRSTCTSSSPGEKRERSRPICCFYLQTFLGVCTNTAAISCSIEIRERPT